MSIIHDALKKVQRGLTPAPKAVNIPEPQATTAKNTSGYLYETPTEIEILPPAEGPAAVRKPPVKNIIKSILALICATAITAVSAWYIWQELRTGVPQVQTFTKKSINTLIHKINPLTNTPKPPAPVVLKPLAQITINPAAVKNPNEPKTAPVTLDIHGIMSKGTSNLVLINDQVYQEGDEVEGAKIVKINLDSITVINNGEEQTIHVKN
jgi:hypothetical protein